MMEYRLKTPLTNEDVNKLHSGDKVFLSGLVYTARDAAHKRLFDSLNAGEKPPFPLQGAVIYYVGPTPAPPGRVIGAAGPTTSGRMDKYAPLLHSMGVKATIGKGRRNIEVCRALQENRAVYFGATGGAGALLSQHIIEAQIIAYEAFGTEAIRQLRVKDFPLLVVNDCHGGELYARPSIKN